MQNMSNRSSTSILCASIFAYVNPNQLLRVNVLSKRKSWAHPNWKLLAVSQGCHFRHLGCQRSNIKGLVSGLREFLKVINLKKLFHISGLLIRVPAWWRHGNRFVARMYGNKIVFWVFAESHKQFPSGWRTASVLLVKGVVLRGWNRPEPDDNLTRNCFVVGFICSGCVRL